MGFLTLLSWPNCLPEVKIGVNCQDPTDGKMTMNLENPRGFIVFDCDGTLISSEKATFRALSVLLTEYLQREVTAKEVEQKYVADLVKLAANFGIEVQEQTEQARQFILRWQQICAELNLRYELFDGIKELLQDLIKEGLLLYVWTGRDRKTTLEILNELGVAKDFLDFRCMDDTISKPHPQGLYEMLGRECDADKVVMIGDSYTDIQGAMNFGCLSIGACWSTYANVEVLKEMGADHLVSEPKDCLQIILDHIEK